MPENIPTPAAPGPLKKRWSRKRLALVGGISLVVVGGIAFAAPVVPPEYAQRCGSPTSPIMTMPPRWVTPFEYLRIRQGCAGWSLQARRETDAYAACIAACEAKRATQAESPEENADVPPTNDAMEPQRASCAMSCIRVDKPAIYLYPTRPENVRIHLSYAGSLTTTYPEMDADGGWTVHALPDGTLTDLRDGRTHGYLFWEGLDPNASYDLSTGAVVPRDELVPFLQSSLATLGLSDREANEMIVYWLPRYRESPYVLLHFATEQEYDARAPLTVSPPPDTLIRVFLVALPLDAPVDVVPQKLVPATRSGFAVIEWGGALLPH